MDPDTTCSLSPAGQSRRAWLVAALAACVLPRSWAASPETPAALVDLAGRQRMLTQRMVKAYCLSTLSYEGAARQLGDSIVQFDAALQRLDHSIAGRVSLQAPLRDVMTRWALMRPMLGGAASRDRVASLDRYAESLLGAADRFTLALRDTLGGEPGRWVNTAGRTRMLSQRLAKLHCLRLLGQGNAAMADVALATRNELAGSLDALARAPVNTRPLQDDLRLANDQWVFFDAALNNLDRGGIGNVATTSERMLEIMDHATGLYAALDGRGP